MDFVTLHVNTTTAPVTRSVPPLGLFVSACGAPTRTVVFVSYLRVWMLKTCCTTRPTDSPNAAPALVIPACDGVIDESSTVNGFVVSAGLRPYRTALPAGEEVLLFTPGAPTRISSPDTATER